MRAMFKAEKMITCFELKKPAIGGKPAKIINVLTEPEHCREVSRLTPEDAMKWRADMGPDSKEDDVNDGAFAAITFTIHESHHFTRDFFAVCFAYLSESFKPTDNASMHELNSRLQQASIEDCSLDVEQCCS